MGVARKNSPPMEENFPRISGDWEGIRQDGGAEVSLEELARSGRAAPGELSTGTSGTMQMWKYDG